MPIYEYRCAECGHQQEVLQKVSEPPLSICPACGKPKLQKLLSAAGFQLKGSGWYATDFKGAGKKPAEKSDAKADKGAEPKAGSKPGDSKPDSKVDPKADPKPEPKTDSKSQATCGADACAACD